MNIQIEERIAYLIEELSKMRESVRQSKLPNMFKHFQVEEQLLWLSEHKIILEEINKSKEDLSTKEKIFQSIKARYNNSGYLI